MKSRNRLARAAKCLALALALTAFGCPGDDEFGLYCSLMSLVAGPTFDFESCYDYNPEEQFAHRMYFDDVRAYQGLVAQHSVTGPGAPSFDAFMGARYPDWDMRSEALRATMRVTAAEDSTVATDR